MSLFAQVVNFDLSQAIDRGLRGRSFQAITGRRRIVVPPHRYVQGAMTTITMGWAMSALYLALAPVTFTSRWSFIIPGTGSATTIQLDQIGQATTSSSDAFGSTAISPKVIYKEIIQSEQVTQAAAQLINESAGHFPKVRVKLIDETALMMFEISGSNPEHAQERARALIEAFNQRIDRLRQDEIDRRSQAVAHAMEAYEANLKSARSRVVTKQAQSGVFTQNQYQDAAQALEALHKRLNELKAERDRLDAEQKNLIARLGIEPSEAAVALKLAADPSFSKLAQSFAEANSTYLEEVGRLGPNHPLRIQIEKKRSNVYAQIVAIARRNNVEQAADLSHVIITSSGVQQAELLRSIMSNAAAIAGRNEEIAALEADAVALEARVKAMGLDLAKIDELKKEDQVAEAVFNTAVARLDTKKSDVYASYPIVQVLAQPDLPDEPSQPRPIYALAGGAGSTILLIFAWSLAWLRANSARRPKKSA